MPPRRDTTDGGFLHGLGEESLEGKKKKTFISGESPPAPAPSANLPPRSFVYTRVGDEATSCIDEPVCKKFTPDKMHFTKSIFIVLYSGLDLRLFILHVTVSDLLIFFRLHNAKIYFLDDDVIY